MTAKPASIRSLSSFVGVSFIYLMMMAATTIPTPLYPIYQERMHFSLFTGTIIFAVYVIGVLIALLGFGPWSDIVGRKPLLKAAIVSAIVSTVLMIVSDLFPAEALALLLVGRLFSGLAVGLFVGAATAVLVEIAPPALESKASFLSTAVNVTGLGFGPLLAGVMVVYVPPPLQSVFWLLLVCLVVGLVIVWRMPETVAVQPGAHGHAQHLSLPADVRTAFFQAAVPGFAGFAALGLFGAVSPDLLKQMGISNAVAQGLIIFAVFVASGLTQLVVKPLPLARTMQGGCVLLAAGALVLLWAIVAQSWLLLLAGGVISSIGQGATFSKGIAHVGETVAPTARAGVTSLLFVCFYIGLTVPAVGVGAAALVWGLGDSAIAFAAVMTLLALVALAINLKTAQAAPAS